MGNRFTSLTPTLTLNEKQQFDSMPKEVLLNKHAQMQLIIERTFFLNKQDFALT